MKISEYEAFVTSMLLGTPSKDRFALCLAEEVGELCGKLKRVHRGDTVLPRDEIKELGDILFYLAAYTHTCGSNLEEVMIVNQEKLLARKRAGTIKGEGDSR